MDPPSPTQTTETHSPNWRHSTPLDTLSGRNLCTLLLTIPWGQSYLPVPAWVRLQWQDSFTPTNMLPLLFTIPQGMGLFPSTFPFVARRQDFIRGMNLNTQSIVVSTAGQLLLPLSTTMQQYKQDTSVPLNLCSLISTLSMFGGLGQPLTPPLFPNPHTRAMSPELLKHLEQSRINLRDTMFGSSGEPLRGSATPNPMLFRPSVALLTHAESTRLNLLGRDTFYGTAGYVRSYDWPNPRIHNYSIALRTFLHSVVLELIGQDVMFGLAGKPIPTTSWMIPQLRITTPDTKGIILFQMPLVLALIPFVPPSLTVTTIINELELGPAFITRTIELLRNQ